MKHTAPFLATSNLGVSRYVLLVGRWAVKIPRVNYGWRLFLQGLLCNMQERAFSFMGSPRLCPVVFAAPGGWLVVMRRVRVMTEVEFMEFDIQEWWDEVVESGFWPPVEKKSDSFGWLDGKVVAIDYGS